MKNNKLGLYAKYEKETGTFIGTVVKKRTEIYNSNKQSQLYVHELLTEKEDLIYNFPESKIPKKALSFNDIMFMSTNSNYHLCDLCGEYFESKDMDYIPTKEDLEKHPGICAQCVNCA